MFAPDTKVLIVDDMKMARMIVARALTEAGLAVHAEAADGELAWQMLSAPDSKIGLIVSDWNMPNLSGFELLKRVRADARFNKIPFVIITAETEAQQARDAITNGADGYLLKPFKPEDLKARLVYIQKKRAVA